MKATTHQTNEIIEIVGDLLVAADGCLSSIRQSFVPDHKLRFVNVNPFHEKVYIFSLWYVIVLIVDGFVGIQVIVHGEAFLIFQEMRIQKL